MTDPQPDSQPPTSEPRSVAYLIGETHTSAEADAVARAYALGHSHGVGCGVESAGFGFVECEHVGRFAADRTPPTRSDIELLCYAILGGTSHLPHREAADRVLAALRSRR